MKKLIISIIAMFFCGVAAFAQLNTPPMPNPNNEDNATDIYGNSRQVNHGPVGTATALLVTLGAGAVAYRIRKNKKEED